MGVQTITIKTCDRCGAQIRPLREVSETGELTVSWHGDLSAIGYDGAAGGCSHKGGKLLCLSCMRGFFAFMEKPNAGVSGTQDQTLPHQSPLPSLKEE